MMKKMAGFNLRVNSSLILGGGGINFAFYFVRHCLSSTLTLAVVLWNKFDEVQSLQFALFKQKEMYGRAYGENIQHTEIGHFRVHVCLLFKASLSAKFLL